MSKVNLLSIRFCLDRSLRLWGARFILVVVVLALFWQMGLAILVFLTNVWKAISFPFPLDYGEGPLLDQALHLARFKPIYYADFNHLPYTIANYPPFFILLQVPFVWLVGPAFWYGRALSTLGILLGSICIGFTLHTITNNRLAAITGGLTLIAFPYVLYWAPMNRVDSLALGLSLAGLFTIIRWPQHRRGRVFASALFVAAIFTKQSYGLTAPFAALFWLANTKNYRWSFDLTLYITGLVLVMVLLLVLLTNGGFFINTVTANINPYFWSRTQAYINQFLYYGWFIFLVAGMYLVLGWKCVRREVRQLREWYLIAPYLLGSIISALMVGKVGSNVNYFLEFCAGTSLAIGVVIARTERFH